MAQQRALPIVGFLRSSPIADAGALVSAFRDGLRQAGFVADRNVEIDIRSAENQVEGLPGLAAALIRRQPAVIVGDFLSARAVQAATASVPVVFVSGADPVREGLVVSLSRPGGSITGLHFFASVLGAKRLDLLLQLVPQAKSIGLLAAANSPASDQERSDVAVAAQTLGRTLLIRDITSGDEIDAAVTDLAQRGVEALLVGSGTLTFSNRDRLVELAAQHRIPASYSNSGAVLSGGLMSYGPSTVDAYRQAGLYAGRILKGEKPGDLPVIQSTKFELALNVKTAKSLGLEVPQTLLALADEAIE